MIKKSFIAYLIFSLCSFAFAYEQEKFNWSFARDWATFDKELKVYYRFLPMTEQALDAYKKLDRRYNYECLVKQHNLRNYFKTGSLVIGLYIIKECQITGRNPNWKKE